MAIADYIVFPNKAAYKSEHCTLERKTGENDLDKLFFTFVELPKFNDQLKAAQRKLEDLTLEEKWYYFLSHAPVTTEQELEVLSETLALKEAYRVLARREKSSKQSFCVDRTHPLGLIIF